MGICGVSISRTFVSVVEKEFVSMIVLYKKILVSLILFVLRGIKTSRLLLLCTAILCLCLSTVLNLLLLCWRERILVVYFVDFVMFVCVVRTSTVVSPCRFLLFFCWTPV